mgnify:CR=1 FL=1
MNGFHRFPYRLAAILMFSLTSSVALGVLNDTGQQDCYNSTAVAECITVAADTDSHPRQDARFGRDAAAAAGELTKAGSGAAGFDFTKVCMSGELAGEGTCPANPTQGITANEWACTKDNTTNLIWSLESRWSYYCSDYSGYITELNNSKRCGYDAGWRIPNRRELLSIVHYGTSSPAIDRNYFPSTHYKYGYYWTIDTYAPDGNWGWIVNFQNGSTTRGFKLNIQCYQRAVHNGPVN